MTRIRSYCFYNCSSLQSIVIPDNVSYIEDRVFAECTNLKNIVVGKKVTSFIKPYSGSFPNLETVTFRCQTVGNWFSGITSLKNIIFENTVQAIDYDAFSGCENIETIYIPKSIISIDYRNPFRNCTGLREIVVDEENPNYSSLNNVLFNKDKTKLLAFANQSSDNYVIPNIVTDIADYAFYNCNNLKSITIPASTTNISVCALAGCQKLESIYTYATTPPTISSYAFDNFDKRFCTLYVPKESYMDYWLAPVWGDFINIEEFDPTGIHSSAADVVENGERYYSVEGKELASPQTGLNIVKSNNGKVKKVYVK